MVWTPSPDRIAALLTQGLAQHNASDFEGAEKLYRQALALAADRTPSQADALHFLGVLLHQKGDSHAGAALLEQAAPLKGQNPDFLADFGLVLKEDKRWGKAKEVLRHALTRAPRHPGALCNLALILGEEEDFAGAVAHLRQLLALDPADAESRVLLARALIAVQEQAEAETHLREALRLDPRSARAEDAALLLAEVLRDKGKVGESPSEWEELLAGLARKTPPCFEALVLLAEAREAQGDREGRDAWLARARAEQPDAAKQYFAQGLKLLDAGGNADVRRAWRRALALDPGHPRAAWSLSLFVPVVYGSADDIEPARAAFGEGLAHLERSYGPDSGMEANRAFLAAGSWSNFFLAYQEQDDRDFQERYARLVSGIVARRFPEFARTPSMPEPEPDGRLRIGFLSAFFRRHSVARLYSGWFEALDRRRFRTFAYQTDARTDRVTDLIAGQCDAFRRFDAGKDTPLDDYPAQFEAIARAVAADRLHALVFTDLGMDTLTFALAALRLAPVQATGLGHPVTTGFPSIDYFLSGDLVERDDAQKHYSETLVRLPNISFRLYDPGATGRARTRPRSYFGFQSGDVVFLAAQSVFKYLPHYDRIFPAIAKAVPAARFAFVRSGQPRLDAKFMQRLKRAFAAQGLDADRHCRFLDRMTEFDFGALNAVADVALDTPGWSGGNTTHEAIGAGLPVVTLPGEFARGRVSAGMLRMIGVEDGIARDVDDYIAIAVRLGQDEGTRRAVRARIEANRAKLYNDDACVRGLEDFLVRAVAERVGKI